MEAGTSPRRKSKSPAVNAANIKASVTCTNVPEGLFDASAAKKHFSKFGKAQKITLLPKKRMCIVEYEQPISAQRAVLNAGAFDGFMFDVTSTKARVRKRSKRDDDPDWLPDPEVEKELSAMSGAPSYRVSRQKAMQIEPSVKIKPIVRVIKQTPIRKPVQRPLPKKAPVSQNLSNVDIPMVVSIQTTLSTAEAANELHQLRSRVSLTPDEQWRILDARDRILRAWGGAGSRVTVGGATIGTCLDMCPEKELLHRQAEHQVMTLETVEESDGQLDPGRAVKQYSRSSADQEIPMCYELRPASALMRTTAYLLREVADTRRQVSLADWFHFMWDRFRGIRKDITQQALCCAESIQLVEICARFHAHCAARLADLEHTQFDQRLNTDNLTKCLQTLKHMYGDVGPEMKPREAEFRGYIALLNLGDANFWWEIKQLPHEIQKSEAITFAMQIFNALDNNNYVRFFRLVAERATYLQACILLRYFNDVRARALARIVKAYAARGQSKYPAEELMNCLAFESIESMKSFVNHYGLRFAKDDSELTIILNRNQFIEDSDPYPIARAVNLIESKRQSSIGEVIAGGVLPHLRSHALYTSFTNEGKLKEAALTAEDQGYNTVNDSNKDVQALKSEIQRLGKGVRNVTTESKTNLFFKSDSRSRSPAKGPNVFAAAAQLTLKPENELFSFKPAIQVAPSDIIEISSDKLFSKNMFSFSKPQNSESNTFTDIDAANLFKATGKSIFSSKTDNSNRFTLTSSNNTLFDRANNEKNLFSQAVKDVNNTDASKNLFIASTNKNIFGRKDEENIADSKYIFAKATKDIFLTKVNNIENGGNIFAKVSDPDSDSNSKDASNVFGSFSRTNNLFAKQGNYQNKPFCAQNGEASSKLSPGSLFKSANNIDGKGYSIFQSKNKPSSVADNILNSVQPDDVYEFSQNKNDADADKLELQRLNEQTIREKEERKLKDIMEKEEQRKQELNRQEVERRKEEERKIQEENKKIEENRKREEERKDELKKKLEAERRAELKRKAEEEKRKFEEKVDKESVELTEKLIYEVRDETLREILTVEIEHMKSLMSFAKDTTEEIWIELCDEIALSEMKAEKFWTEKLLIKWFEMWKKQFIRNFKRRRLLEDTPVWLTDKTPAEEAINLRRSVENAALKNMNAIHKGYKFDGEWRPTLSQEPYNIMEIIRSALLKRMKQINYPYDKCFFWKITVVSPGARKWICRKIELEKWLMDALSDKNRHDISESLIRVEKQTWNRLMDFAISVSLANENNKHCWSEAMEGSNGLLYYVTENDDHVIETITEMLKQKYPHQIIPVAIVLPKVKDDCKQTKIEYFLAKLVKTNSILSYKIIKLDPENVFSALNVSTKSALKWLARHYPVIPPLEIDHLKAVCQRYLGNEMWYRFKSEKDNRMHTILKDLGKVVKFYNLAVDKLTEAITSEDIFNHATFPLEFKEYLDHTTPYPKPYEFITANMKNSDNSSAIRNIMMRLKLPEPSLPFQPMSIVNFQDQIRKYCNQIAWFENPEQVVCKIVAVMPNEFSDLEMPHDKFIKYFQHYDLLDFMNIIVYEKINGFDNLDNTYAVYDKAALQNYCNMNWLYEMDVLSNMKHKPIDYKDDIDIFIEAKRRKIELDSMEYLMLEDKDCTIVEENVKATEESISRYSTCEDAVKQLEEQINLEKQKSMDLENLLRSALCNV